MANRPIELKSKCRPTIVHENQNLNQTQIQQNRQTESSSQRNIREKLALPSQLRNQNSNSNSQIDDDAARSQNLNRSRSVESDNSNQSDIPPETTLFDQIAIQVARYKGNLNYLQRLPGILNLFELLFGLLTFILILVACNNYYDPWQVLVVSGFTGGKVEVFFFLTCTYGLITTSIFTVLILISNSYEKILNAGNFKFIISFALFAFIMFSSVLLLIELSNRNTGILEFERRFGVKVTCAILGILNSLCYLLSSSIVFKIPSSHERPKHSLTRSV